MTAHEELPLISINLWAFTSSKDLQKSIKSLVELKYSHKEILIACPETATAIKDIAYQAVEQYAGIRLFELDEKQTLFGAQVLWEKSQGDYVVPVLAGTTLEPEALHKLHMALATQQYLRPEVQAVLANTRLTTKHFSASSLQMAETEKQVMMKYVHGLPILSGASMFLRKNSSPFAKSQEKPYFWWGSSELLNLVNNDQVVTYARQALSSMENYEEIFQLPGIRIHRDKILTQFIFDCGLNKLYPGLEQDKDLALALEKTARNLIETHAIPALYTALLLVETANLILPSKERAQRQKEIQQMIPARLKRDFPLEKSYQSKISAQELLQTRG